MFNKTSKTFTLGDQTITLETGQVARQAHGAVMVNVDGTVVLVTVVASKESRPGQDFFPLTVDYTEKVYAAGRIPGGFFKREGRPSEHEILTSRLIDRSIRPLFPKGFLNEVQVIATVMSFNPEVSADMPAILGVSAALAISGIPFVGPVAGLRVGYINDALRINPTTSDMANSQLDLIIAGNRNAVLMVESEAQMLNEEIMLAAINYGHEHIAVAIDAISELVAEAGKPAWQWQAPEDDQKLVDRVRVLAFDQLVDAYRITEKGDRTSRVKEIRTSVLETLAAEMTDLNEVAVKNHLHNLESEIVRNRILNGESRIDGRDTRTVRPIAIDTGLLPRTHGSALFTRGETQAMVVATLGTNRDEQIIDALGGESRDRFMFHYNMPPYATGETGRFGVPKRREIGHGRLAKRALIPVLPDSSEFSYAIRLVSEITESNGSSSMASVCGGCLALMDAGVPVKAHVAGIAMGLIKEDNRFAVLSDILGDEDHLGDMDFKVAGTAEGITALQMDIKIQGITSEIMEVALSQAKEGRLHILNKMNETITEARDDISSFAPRLFTLSINPEKIRDVIGKGGSVIREITEETGTSIDISEQGHITIASINSEMAELARKRIQAIVQELEIGGEYEGTVQKILDFGAIVSILPGRDGLLHISQIAHEHVNKVADYVTEGQTVKVKVIESDAKGRVRLSMKALIPKPAPAEPTPDDGGDES